MARRRLHPVIRSLRTYIVDVNGLQTIHALCIGTVVQELWAVHMRVLPRIYGSRGLSGDSIPLMRLRRPALTRPELCPWSLRIQITNVHTYVVCTEYVHRQGAWRAWTCLDAVLEAAARSLEPKFPAKARRATILIWISETSCVFDIRSSYLCNWPSRWERQAANRSRIRYLPGCQERKTASSSSSTLCVSLYHLYADFSGVYLSLSFIPSN